MRVRGYAIVAMAVLLLAGCGGKSSRELRSEGIERLGRQDYAQARALFDQILEKSKGKLSDLELDVLKYKAEADYQLADYQAAADSYSRLISEDGEKTEYLLKRCLVYIENQETALALDDYTRAQVKDMDAANAKVALTALVGALIRQDEAQKARIIYEQAVNSGLNDPAVFNQLGIIEFEHENFVQAAELFKQGAALGEGGMLKELELNYAVVHIYDGKYDDARSLLEAYLAKYGADPEVEKELAFLNQRS